MSLSARELHDPKLRSRPAAFGTSGMSRSRSLQLGSRFRTGMLEWTGAAAIVSYEEYHPYGTTAWWTLDSGIDVSEKRYRYTGKEKDEETGLYYHGARYYAPWLGRWPSADPAGMVDGTNRYAYSRGSPIRRMDPNGKTSTEGHQWLGRSFSHGTHGVTIGDDASIQVEEGDWLSKYSAAMHNGDVSQVRDFYRRVDGEYVAVADPDRIVAGETLYYGPALDEIRFSTAARMAQSEPDAPLYDRFEITLRYMHQEMIANAQGEDVAIMRGLNESPTYRGATRGAALARWTGLVRAGAPWDHKPILDEMLDLSGPPKDYFFPIPGAPDVEVYYDIWSNIHYGYAGAAAGFDTDTLLSGPAVPISALTGANDEGDSITVMIGIDLWNEYGTDLTEEGLHRAILDALPDLLEAQEADPTAKKIISSRNNR